jgi:hypothetical protein
MQKVGEMSQGTVKVGPGTLYGAFTTLETEGLIVKVGGGRPPQDLRADLLLLLPDLVRLRHHQVGVARQCIEEETLIVRP